MKIDVTNEAFTVIRTLAEKEKIAVYKAVDKLILSKGKGKKTKDEE